MNWDLMGHEWAVDLLREHIIHQRLRQAYLISGPTGVGRRTLALSLTKALNCSQPPRTGEFCGICRACSHIQTMTHPDLSVIQATEIGGVLKVEDIREVQRSLSLAPYEAQYRVVLFLRFEEANPAAANALLKTLEEPASRVVLILTAESPESLLPTIVSRCEVLRLKPLPIDSAIQGMQNLWGFLPEQAQLLSHVSNGRPGYARRLAEDPVQMNLRDRWLEEMIKLLSEGLVERFTYVDSLPKSQAIKQKDYWRPVLLVWLTFWRDILLQTTESSVSITNSDRKPHVVAIADRVGKTKARKTVMALQRTYDQLSKNINPRLAMEVLMLDLPLVE